MINKSVSKHGNINLHIDKQQLFIYNEEKGCDVARPSVVAAFRRIVETFPGNFCRLLCNKQFLNYLTRFIV